MRDLIDAYVEALNAHDPERAAKCYTDDAVVTQRIQRGNTFTGHDEIAGWVGDNLAGLPDLQVSMRSLVAGDDAVAWEWTYRGTYTGQFPGAPKGGGQAVTLDGMSVMEIRDGRIAREVLYFDNLSFLTQIGVTDHPTFKTSGTQ